LAGLTSQLFHHHETQVLVADIKNKARSALIDPFGHVSLHKEIVNLIASACIVLIDEIEWIPLEVEIFIVCLTLPEGMERLIKHHI
jgi:hypothetical protein